MRKIKKIYELEVKKAIEDPLSIRCAIPPFDAAGRRTFSVHFWLIL